MWLASCFTLSNATCLRGDSSNFISSLRARTACKRSQPRGLDIGCLESICSSIDPAQAVDWRVCIATGLCEKRAAEG